MRALVVVLLIACVAAASAESQQKQTSLMERAMKVIEISRALSKRQDEESSEAEDRQEKDSYLEALEYSHNSASLQGVEGSGFAGFFRPITDAISEFGIGRAGIAAAIAAPVVAIAGMALLAPLALGRKKRDLSALFGESARSEPDAIDRLRSRVEQIYTDVVRSDDCIERFVCEVGSAAKNVYYKDSILRVVKYFTPDSYKRYTDTLKSAVHASDTVKCRNIKCKPIGL